MFRVVFLVRNGIVNEKTTTLFNTISILTFCETSAERIISDKPSSVLGRNLSAHQSIILIILLEAKNYRTLFTQLKIAGVFFNPNKSSVGEKTLTFVQNNFTP